MTRQLGSRKAANRGEALARRMIRVQRQTDLLHLVDALGPTRASHAYAGSNKAIESR